MAGTCTRPVAITPLTDAEKRVIGPLLDMWNAQQLERDRISGFQLRVFLALTGVVFIVCLWVCVACVCCACAAQQQKGVLSMAAAAISSEPAAARQHDSDDEDESIWHRP